MARSISYNAHVTSPRKGWYFLFIPNELLGGTGKRVWIRGTLDGKPFKATANPSRDGMHEITLNRQMREAHGIDSEREVRLEFEVLSEPILDLDVPDDLARALEGDAGARRTWDRIPPSHQKEFIFYLDEVKRESTRAARLAKSLGVLRRGRHLYEDPAKRFADDLK
ncbi:MAG: DUF1905 domain-containing protein [Coriobacteriales bacterium]|nr:DUF1905 domain-containing protein [Coriobacteriales bacterium]